MVEPVRHRRTKGAATDMLEPKATASHLDSTIRVVMGTSGVGAKRTFQTSAASSAGVLRDRNDLKLLTGCTDYIPNSFAHQKLCHWGYEGNRTGLRVRFVLSHDIIFLYAPIVAPEGHRAPKGNSVS